MVNLNKDSWISHKRLAHSSIDLIGKLSQKDIVVGLPKLNYIKGRFCDECQKDKQVKSSFKSKKIMSISKPSDILHVELIGLSRSYRGNFYILVILGDYFRFPWTLFLNHKSDTFEAFKKLENVI